MESDHQASGEALREAPPFTRFARIPLNDRRGRPRAYALIDEADLPLVEPFHWHLDTDGYATRTVDAKRGVKERMARRILGLRPGDGLESDHISRDALDNRRSNLRIVSHAQNSQNRVRTDGLSRHRGVSFRKDRKSRPWCAYACLDRKQVHLGFYDTEDDAAAAARRWRAEHMPFATE